MPDGTERDGEADFVLAHPDLGMLVLEVKGGQVSCDAVNGKWHSTDRSGDRFTIKNPVQQAMTSKHRLLDILRGTTGWKGRYITARHAVVFPDCVRPMEDLAPDMPAWLFAGIGEMSSLGLWVEERLEQHFPAEISQPDELNDDGLELLTNLFVRSFQLHRPMVATLLSDDEAIRVLTDQQSMILDILESRTRLAIPGSAGTGKTSLAIEKVRRLAAEGRKTLLTCYNKPLALQLERELAGVSNVKVNSFHSLCIEIAARSETLESRIASQGSAFFDRDLPNALLRGLHKSPSDKFDAVVIDEGQDFLESWMPAVEALLKDKEKSQLFVVFDDNQRVYSKAHSLAGSIPTSGVRLTRILRNGRTIVEAIARLIPKPYRADGPDGMPVAWIEEAGAIDATSVVFQLDKLIDEEHIGTRQIAVIVPDQRYLDKIVNSGCIGNYRVVDAEATPGSLIVCDTVRRFKGLERPVVILVDPERMMQEPAALYVGLTRARLVLILLAPHGGLDQLRSLLS
ncbi:ATP-binding domain-containing protein [soil metagenome]